MEHSFALCCYSVDDVLNLSNQHFVQTKQDLDKTKISKDFEKEAHILVRNLQKGKYLPDVVQKHRQNSTPIKRSTFESALNNLYLKIYEGDKNQAKQEVQDRIKNSERVATKTFSSKASNCFCKHGGKTLDVTDK